MVIKEDRILIMKISRSEFFKKLFVSTISFTGIIAFIEACGGNEEKQQTQRLIWKKIINKSEISKREIFALFGFFKKLK